MPKLKKLTDTLLTQAYFYNICFIMTTMDFKRLINKTLIL